MVQEAEEDGQPSYQRDVFRLNTLFLEQFVATNLKWQMERKLWMRVKGKDKNIIKYQRDVMQMCRKVQPARRKTFALITFSGCLA